MSYILGGLLALVAALGILDYLQRADIQHIHSAQAAATQRNKDQNDAAQLEKDDEIKALNAYRAAHPDTGPIQLCVLNLQTRKAPAAAAGAPSAVVSAVHGSDPGVRADQPAQPGPDISGLLKAYAAVAGQVDIDLQQQQAVQ